MGRPGRVAVVVFLIGCTRPAPDPPPAPPAPPSAEWVRSSIESVAQHYKVYTLNSDSRGIASLFATDGRLEVKGLPSMVGPMAIDAGLRAAFGGTKYTTWEISFDEIRGLSADMAVARGSTYSVTESKGKAAQGWHRWMATYKRGGDGMYRIVSLAAFPDSVR